MSGGGRGGDSRRNRRRYSQRREQERERETRQAPSQENTRNSRKAADALLLGESKLGKNRSPLYERPRWKAPQLATGAIPAPDCPFCGKPIKDLAAAIADRYSGKAVHFDCVLARIGAEEHLDPGDTLCYIGGGRFGVVHFNNPPDNRNFSIKKIFEWENKDSRSEWRQFICDHFSLT
jgi:hypothetical protein